MNVLFVTKDFSGASLCLRLKKEGHNVKALALDHYYSGVLDGIINIIESMEIGIEWVGKDGLIIFDRSGYGKIQDELRSKGFSVFGGNEIGDNLEIDRQYAQEVFNNSGIKTVPIFTFNNIQSAIDFIKKKRGYWVIKPNNNDSSKEFTYVGQLPNGEDVIDILFHYNECNREYLEPSFILQKKIEGIEIAVGRYFNGKEWIGPICFTVEHKRLFPGDLGPNTDEMGTLMWYCDNDNNRLFNETLAKIKPFLQQIDFRGDIDINCIVNEKGAFPLEATPRLGFPTTQLQIEIHKSPWGDFLKAIADGKRYKLSWKKGYGIVVLLATPPFPFWDPRNKNNFSPRGLKIHFREDITFEDLNHIHFTSISLRKDEQGEKIYQIADDLGDILHVTAIGHSIEEARNNVYKLIEKIVIPKAYFRTDIGLDFLHNGYEIIKNLNYL